MLCSDSVVLPKTGYTYAKSGSYSPRHLRKSYVNPNMSRRRLRGTASPPTGSRLDNSDPDDLNDELDYGQSVGIQQHADASVSHTHAPTADYSASYAGLYETDQLDFDSDDADHDDGDPAAVGTSFNSKVLSDMENLRIQHSRHPQDLEYTNYHEGMILRSASRVKGVRSYLQAQDPSRSKTMSAINHSPADWTSNAHAVRATASMSGVYGQRWRSGNPAYDVGFNTTTTVTRTVTKVLEDELNQNNNARVRPRSRSPAKMNMRTGRGGNRARLLDSEYEFTQAERKRMADAAYKQEKKHRLCHMYGLDQTDDFSDSDSYSYPSSSFTSAAGYSRNCKRNNGCLARSMQCARTWASTAVDWLKRKTRPVTSRIMDCVICPMYNYGARTVGRMWRQVTAVAKCFILLEAWILSRNIRKLCCLGLPILLFLPLLFVGGHYAAAAIQSGSFPFSLPSFFQDSHTIQIREGDTLQTINLHHEVKQVLRQLHSEKRDWLTRLEIQALVKGMLSPEMESLRVSLLNIANAGNSDQAALKVDQNDAKLRLVSIDGQLASLKAKAKFIEGDLADSKSNLVGTLTGDRDKQAANLASTEKALVVLRSQVGALEASFIALSARSKGCCVNDTALVGAIRGNINHIMGELFGADDKGGGGSAAFAVWLNQNYVDRGEFEQQLRLVTTDITNRIKSAIESQRSGHSSSFVLPPGTSSLGENAVKLIVEDALLKFSADRTGLPDYALESAGGSVLSVRCSETYYRKTALISVFGIPLWYTSNSPRTVIQPEVYPGQCWAFKGESGYSVIQLSVPVRPTGFSLEHIPKSLSMTGSIDSAPREFTVYGLISGTDMKGVSLGNFTYQTVGKPIQHFDVQIRNPGVFGYVELRVLNNHGNKDYTCVYRFRVHGVPHT